LRTYPEAVLTRRDLRELGDERPARRGP
jgi:hypothetical protein